MTSTESTSVGDMVLQSQPKIRLMNHLSLGEMPREGASHTDVTHEYRIEAVTDLRRLWDGHLTSIVNAPKGKVPGKKYF